MIALDTETRRFAYGNMAPGVVCLSWCHPSDPCHPSGGVVSRLDRARLVDLWCSAISGQGDVSKTTVPSLPAWGCGAVGHHIAYDVACMWASFPETIVPTIDAYEGDRVTDTILRQKLLDIASGTRDFRPNAAGEMKKSTYGLDALARDMLGVRLEGKGTIQLRYGELWDTPVDRWPDGFARYAMADTATTLALYDRQTAQAAARKIPLDDQWRQARGALWLHLSAVWSIVPDAQRIDDFERSLIVERDGIAGALLTAGLLKRNTKTGELTRDTKRAAELQAYAYASTGREVPLTPTGRVQLKRAKCEESGNEELDVYSQYGALNTLLTKDVPALRNLAPVSCRTPGPKGSGGCGFARDEHDAFGRHTPKLKIDTLLWTGRTSYGSPNLQNLPRKEGARECLAARPGTVFLCGDFSGFELATLAQACLDLLGRSTLADQLNAGIDPHLAVAAQIAGVPYAEALAAYRAEESAGGKGGYWATLRQIGKVANFGLPGGLGAQTLVFYALQSYGVHLTLAESQALKATWLRTLPEMGEFFRAMHSMTERGYLVQLRANRVRAGARFTATCNSHFQGPASDIMKAVGWAIMRAQYDPRNAHDAFGAPRPLWGTRTVLEVHDEYVLEVPDDAQRLADCAAALRAHMTGPIVREWLPGVRLGADLKAMRRYSKKPKGDNVVPIGDAGR